MCLQTVFTATSADACENSSKIVMRYFESNNEKNNVLGLRFLLSSNGTFLDFMFAGFGTNNFDIMLNVKVAIQSPPLYNVGEWHSRFCEFCFVFHVILQYNYLFKKIRVLTPMYELHFTQRTILLPMTSIAH